VFRPESRKVFEFLGTQFSFAFEFENATDAETLRRFWVGFGPVFPKDLSVFQPVMLAEGTGSGVRWVVIDNEEDSED
jgi:hypothetical protein